MYTFKRGSFFELNGKEYKLIRRINLGMTKNSKVWEVVHGSEGFIAKFSWLRYRHQHELNILHRLSETPLAEIVPKVMDSGICRFSGMRIYVFIMYPLPGKPLIELEPDLDEELLQRIADQLREVVSELHGLGFVHNDIMSFNVLWDGERVYLVDFSDASDDSDPIFHDLVRRENYELELFLNRLRKRLMVRV